MSGKILSFVAILVTMYVVSLIAGFLYTQMMAIITQGSLKKMREKMFDHMQDLPIKYFDTNGRGDIMSYYTNDVDTLRQMISQSLPQMLISGVTLLTLSLIHICGNVEHQRVPANRAGDGRERADELVVVPPGILSDRGEQPDVGGKQRLVCPYAASRSQRRSKAGGQERL